MLCLVTARYTNDRCKTSIFAIYEGDIQCRASEGIEVCMAKAEEEVDEPFMR